MQYDDSLGRIGHSIVGHTQVATHVLLQGPLDNQRSTGVHREPGITILAGVGKIVIGTVGTRKERNSDV